MPDGESNEGSGFKLDIDFPWEDVLSDGLKLVGQLLEDRPFREKQYMSFWWTHDLWRLRKTTIGDQAAGPEPVFEDFVLAPEGYALVKLDPPEGEGGDG